MQFRRVDARRIDDFTTLDAGLVLRAVEPQICVLDRELHGLLAGASARRRFLDLPGVVAAATIVSMLLHPFRLFRRLYKKTPPPPPLLCDSAPEIQDHKEIVVETPLGSATIPAPADMTVMQLRETVFELMKAKLPKNCAASDLKFTMERESEGSH